MKRPGQVLLVASILVACGRDAAPTKHVGEMPWPPTDEVMDRLWEQSPYLASWLSDPQNFPAAIGDPVFRIQIERTLGYDTDFARQYADELAKPLSEDAKRTKDACVVSDDPYQRLVILSGPIHVSLTPAQGHSDVRELPAQARLRLVREVRAGRVLDLLVVDVDAGGPAWDSAADSRGVALDIMIGWSRTPGMVSDRIAVDLGSGYLRSPGYLRSHRTRGLDLKLFGLGNISQVVTMPSDYLRGFIAAAEERGIPKPTDQFIYDPY